MPHVDDGTLHALIDGALRVDRPAEADRVEAHLAACEDCRTRLEAAERLRDAAADVLGAADVSPTPDFADVLTRARRPQEPAGDRLRRRVLWTRRLAWAATIVVALGTGYVLRDLAGPVLPSARSGARTEAPSQALDRRDAGADVEAGAGAAETAGRAPAVPSDEADAGGAVVPGEAVPEEGTPTRTAEAEAGAQETASKAVTAPDAGAGLRDRSRAVSEEPAEELALEPGEAARTQSVAEDRADVPRAALPAPIIDREARFLREETDPAALTVDPARWSAATREEADAILEGPLYRLPRATIEEVYVQADPGRVLTLQRLATGIPVRVVQQRRTEPEAADAGASRISATGTDAGPRLPGVERVVVMRDVFVLEVSAALPPELLTTLAEEAIPDGDR